MYVSESNFILFSRIRKKNSQRQNSFNSGTGTASVLLRLNVCMYIYAVHISQRSKRAQHTPHQHQRSRGNVNDLLVFRFFCVFRLLLSISLSTSIYTFAVFFLFVGSAFGSASLMLHSESVLCLSWSEWWRWWWWEREHSSVQKSYIKHSRVLCYWGFFLCSRDEPRTDDNVYCTTCTQDSHSRAMLGVLF